MNSQTIDIKTRDGVCACQFFHQPKGSAAPAIILYMDAFGIRPALAEMSQRLADGGFHVLLPDLYYRAGKVEPVDPSKAFKEGPERDRLMSLYPTLNNKILMEDTASFLAFLDHQPQVTKNKIGCVGYCMGGSFALTAAGTFPGQFRAAASLHGARLATDKPDSPHLLAPKMRAEIYIGIAGIDPHFTPEEKQRLETALQSARVRHTLEVYPDVKHGFAVLDTPAYDRNASDRHFQRITKLFTDNLSN